MSDIQARLRRRWLYLPFAIAAVIVFGYYLLWRAGADEIKKAVSIWVEEQRAAGMDVSYETIQTDGFPFFLRLHVDRPSIAAPGEWAWRAERLSLDALPYELNKIIFSPVGEQRIELADYGVWRAGAGDLRASIARDAEREWVFSANIGDMKARRESDGAEASISSLIFDLAPVPGETATLTLTLAGSGIAYETNPSGFMLDRIQTVTAITHTHLLQGEEPASQWRDGGGALIINGLIAELNAATLSISGDLTLDQAQYPAGRLSAEIANPAGLAETLGDAGVLEPNEAEAAAAGLMLMALAGGGKITAPVELKNGEAQISGVKIAELPQIK